MYYRERQAMEVLRMLQTSEDDPTFGYPINNFRHCLQSATLAHRAGKSENYVVIALLHDIGFTVWPDGAWPVRGGADGALYLP